jgi:hypothetical protein
MDRISPPSFVVLGKACFVDEMVVEEKTHIDIFVVVVEAVVDVEVEVDHVLRASHWMKMM